MRGEGPEVLWTGADSFKPAGMQETVLCQVGALLCKCLRSCGCADRTKGPYEQQNSVLYTRPCMVALLGPFLAAHTVFWPCRFASCLPHLTSHMVRCICLAPML